jgi:hypothetical protein
MKRLHPFAASAALVMATVLLPAVAEAGGGLWHFHGRRGFEPEGTWINTVLVWPRASPDAVCGEPPPTASRFESLTTFYASGEVIEGGGPAAGPPTVAASVSRSAGHGLWERMGWNSFLQSFRQHYFNAAGLLVRVNVVQNVAEFRRGDDPATPAFVEPYHLFGKGTNVITNVLPTGQPLPDGSALATRVYGCNQATSRPYVLEE